MLNLLVHVTKYKTHKYNTKPVGARNKIQNTNTILNLLVHVTKHKTHKYNTKPVGARNQQALKV
jgi:hypothetical protein